MRIPTPPRILPLEHISPSFYLSARACKARACWLAFGERQQFPETPSALLGLAFHSTVERATAKRDEQVYDVARSVFDQAVHDLHQKAHPLLRTKFPKPELLPYYYLVRERAVMAAVEVSGAQTNNLQVTTAASSDRPRRAIERRLSSSDGWLVGRPDLVNARDREVVDYKTNVSPQAVGSPLSEAEVRQLKLYAYLAEENGIITERGTIVRADGRRYSIVISKEEARAEVNEARRILNEYNERASSGATFEDLATPSSESCRLCPCLPICEPFWEAAQPQWAQTCGMHIEGAIVEMEESNLLGTPLTTVVLEASRGSCERGQKRIEQIPGSWLTSSELHLGDVVRATNVRKDQCDAERIRIDKLASALWTLT
ncbi:PD-(D/E)XK nuclease family protein [Oscillatoria amoena NRMC-F 0135]|nr:PD-(D/E)XK nuclease family protein [Oscillatoria amoena NRMC-F 0135]